MDSFPMRCSHGAIADPVSAALPRRDAETPAMKDATALPARSLSRAITTPIHLRNDRARTEERALHTCRGFPFVIACRVRDAARATAEALGGARDIDHATPASVRCVPPETMPGHTESIASVHDVSVTPWRACHRAAMHRIWSNVQPTRPR